MNLKYKPFYQRWLKGKAKYGDTIQENFRDLYQKYFPAVMDRIFEGMTGDEDLAEPLQFITPRTNVNLIEQLTILIDSILPEDPEAAPQEFNHLEKLFLFCLTWSCGGALIEKDRETFNAFLSATAQTMLPHNLYDNVFTTKKNQLELWSARVKEYTPPADGSWANILVPTMDTTRYAWLLTQIQLMKRPVCFLETLEQQRLSQSAMLSRE
jgi:dynein heavy chain